VEEDLAVVVVRVALRVMHRPLADGALERLPAAAEDLDVRIVLTLVVDETNQLEAGGSLESTGE
jgi:hypothetical protein